MDSKKEIEKQRSKDEALFLASSKAVEEVKKVTGKDMPEFKDLGFIKHEEYLQKIQDKDALLICEESPTPEFPDNIQGECDDCGCDIYYRHYNSVATKKVCKACGLKIIEKERKNEQ